MWPHCGVLCVERSVCWNPGPLLAEEAWVEPQRRWPSLSEPQSLYLRVQASSGRMGTAVMVLLQLWVSYGASRCTVRVQGHLPRPQPYCPGAGVRAMGLMLQPAQGSAQLLPACLPLAPLGYRRHSTDTPGVVCYRLPPQLAFGLWSPELWWSLQG